VDGPLPKLCPVILTSNHDGRQAKNRKRRDEILMLQLKFEFILTYTKAAMNN
jgi:hypothetical protein